MKKWRVLEQSHSSCIATKDSDYDKITEFKNRDKAFRYYISVFDDNYLTIYEELTDGKWEYIASSCCNEYI